MNRWINYFIDTFKRAVSWLWQVIVGTFYWAWRVLLAPMKSLPRLSQQPGLGWGAMVLVMLALAWSQTIYFKQANLDYLFYQEVLTDALPDQISGYYEDIQIELSYSDLSPSEQIEELKAFIFSEVDREIIERPYNGYSANYQSGWIMVVLAWITWLMIAATAFKVRLLRVKRVRKLTYLEWFQTLSWVLIPLVLQSAWFAVNSLLSGGYQSPASLQPLLIADYLPEESLAAGFAGLLSLFMVWSLVLLAITWRKVAKISWWESILWTLTLGFFMLPLSVFMG